MAIDYRKLGVWVFLLAFLAAFWLSAGWIAYGLIQWAETSLELIG